MNIRAMKIWIKALRSGVYQQTRGTLKCERGAKLGKSAFCCLGVAARMYEIDTGEKLNWRMVETYSGSNSGKRTSSIGMLPAKVMAWLGITVRDPSLERGIGATEANDALGWDFKRIANALEKKYFKQSSSVG